MKNELKKILFVIPSLEMGGTLVSLNNLLTECNNSYKSRIFILPLSDSGKFDRGLPNCEVLKSSIITSSIIDSVDTTLSRKHSTIRIFIKLFFKFITILGFDIWKIIAQIQRYSFSNKSYDSVVAFQEGLTTTFVSSLRIKKKFAWIHCDYRYYDSFKPISYDYNIYSQYNMIFCVSNYTKDSFLNIFPSFRNKTITLNNIINTNQLENFASFPISDTSFKCSSFTIISVGRISPVKQFCRIPGIVKELMDMGANFHWYLIGGGENIDELTNLYSEISLNNCQSYFTYLGEKSNPYNYIANSNLTVCLSLSESFNYVINESIALGIPVVTTNFGAANEFIKDGITGHIVELQDMAEVINEIIINKMGYDAYKNNCKKWRFDNSKSKDLLNLIIT